MTRTKKAKKLESPAFELVATPKPRNKKNATEFYPTPIPVAKTFAASGIIPLEGRFLEPCVGQGAIIQGFSRHCQQNGIEGPSWTGVELLPNLANVARTRCPKAIILCADALQHSFEPYDVIITNPPFSLAEALYHRLRPLCSYLVFLLRVGWLEADCRQDELLSKDLPALSVISPRPSFSEGGNDNATYAWMVWSPERRTVSEFRIIRTQDDYIQPSLF